MFIYYHNKVSLEEFIEKSGNISITFAGDSLHHQLWDMIWALSNYKKITCKRIQKYLYLSNNSVKESEEPHLMYGNYTNWFWSIEYKNGLKINYLRFYNSHVNKYTLTYQILKY